MGISFVSLMWRLQSSFRFPCVASQGSSQVSWQDNTKTSDAAKMDGPFLGLSLNDFNYAHVTSKWCGSLRLQPRKSLPRKMYENLSEQAGSFIPFCCWGEAWILIDCSEDMNMCRWFEYEYVWVLIRWFLIALVTLFCCGTVFCLSAFQFGRRTIPNLTNFASQHRMTVPHTSNKSLHDGINTHTYRLIVHSTASPWPLSDFVLTPVPPRFWILWTVHVPLPHLVPWLSALTWLKWLRALAHGHCCVFLRGLSSGLYRSQWTCLLTVVTPCSWTRSATWLACSWTSTGTVSFTWYGLLHFCDGVSLPAS